MSHSALSVATLAAMRLFWCVALLARVLTLMLPGPSVRPSQVATSGIPPAFDVQSILLKDTP